MTGRKAETPSVTEGPHADLLARIAAMLASWQREVERAGAEMAPLRDAGVFLDDEGNPVVPNFWDRREEGRGWYLVWPAKYARQSGRPRRERLTEDYEATDRKRKRTQAYLDLKDRHDRLMRQIEQVGEELARMLEKHEW